MLWKGDTFFIRDIHCFDEKLVSPTHDTPLRQTSLVYETLPVVDWAFWSRGRSGHKQAGMWPVLISADGTASPMRAEGLPVVEAGNSTALRVTQPLSGGGTFSMLCEQKKVTLRAVDPRGKPLHYACQLVGGEALKASVKDVNHQGVVYSHSGTEYHLKLGSGSGQNLANGSIQLTPNRSGKLVMTFDPGSGGCRAPLGVQKHTLVND